MHDHRTDGVERPSCRANPSPPVGNVHGLGESHALRIELRHKQLPWLADEIGELRRSIEEAVVRARARHDQLTAVAEDPPLPEAQEAATEADRRIYQLRVLAMIREQLPLTDAAVAAAVASPWDEVSGAPTTEPEAVQAPVAVVGPAQAMLTLTRGATRNVTGALAEALDGPKFTTDPGCRQRRSRGWPEWRRITPLISDRLRVLAAAAEAFTNTYVNVVAQQSYRFDPDYYPVVGDELW